MLNFLRRLMRPKRESESSFEPAQFVYVKIPGDIQPLERGERFEDPLDDALTASGLGHVSGGGSQLDDPHPDGSSRVEYCGIDVDVVDRVAALALIRAKLVELTAPEGTELHYTVGAERLLDRLEGAAWATGLPRSELHPGFGI
jgi:hypothetical protein